MNEINIEECWKKGLIKKIKPVKWLIEKSVQAAIKRLEDAKQSLKAGIYNGAIFFAYMSMFHAAKAILFKDGVREKSHKCVVLYLEENYGKKGTIPRNLIHALDSYRIERHEIVYGFEFIATKEDAEASIDDAKDFLEVVKKIVRLKA